MKKNILPDKHSLPAESVISVADLASTLLEGTGEGAVLVLDSQGTIERMNKSAPTLIGKRLEDLLGTSFFDALQLKGLDGKPLPTELRPTYKVLYENYRQVQPFFCLYQQPGVREPITIALRTVAVLNDRDKRVGAVVYMREAQRNFDPKAIDRSFVSFAAHQLKTPAGVVQGFLEMVLRELSPGDPSRSYHYITAAYEANLGLIRSAKDLLNAAKLRGGLIEPEVREFNLSQVIKHKLAGYEQWITNKHVKLDAEYDLGDQSTVFSDQAIVAELFDIIFHNAVKHVPNSGSIAVRITRNGPMFEISVKDSGFGLGSKPADPADESSGSGMGLRVARQYAALLKGKLLYERVEPQGSLFRLQLPDFKN